MLWEGGIKHPSWFPRRKLNSAYPALLLRVSMKSIFFTIPKQNPEEESLRTSLFTALPSVVPSSFCSLTNSASFSWFLASPSMAQQPGDRTEPGDWDKQIHPMDGSIKTKQIKHTHTPKQLPEAVTASLCHFRAICKCIFRSLQSTKSKAEKGTSRIILNGFLSLQAPRSLLCCPDFLREMQSSCATGETSIIASIHK